MKYLILSLLLSFNSMAITQKEVSQAFKDADKVHDSLLLDRCYSLVNNAIKKEMKYRIDRGDVYHFDMAIIMDYIDKEDQCSSGRLMDGLENRLKKNGFKVKVVWEGINSAYCFLIIRW